MNAIAEPRVIDQIHEMVREHRDQSGIVNVQNIAEFVNRKGGLHQVERWCRVAIGRKPDPWDYTDRRSYRIPVSLIRIIKALLWMFATDEWLNFRHHKDSFYGGWRNTSYKEIKRIAKCTTKELTMVLRLLDIRVDEFGNTVGFIRRFSPYRPGLGKSLLSIWVDGARLLEILASLPPARATGKKVEYTADQVVGRRIEPEEIKTIKMEPKDGEMFGFFQEEPGSAAGDLQSALIVTDPILEKEDVVHPSSPSGDQISEVDSFSEDRIKPESAAPPAALSLPKDGEKDSTTPPDSIWACKAQKFIPQELRDCAILIVGYFHPGKALSKECMQHLARWFYTSDQGRKLTLPRVLKLIRYKINLDDTMLEGLPLPALCKNWGYLYEKHVTRHDMNNDVAPLNQELKNWTESEISLRDYCVTYALPRVGPEGATVKGLTSFYGNYESDSLGLPGRFILAHNNNLDMAAMRERLGHELYRFFMANPLAYAQLKIQFPVDEWVPKDSMIKAQLKSNLHIYMNDLAQAQAIASYQSLN